MAKKHISTLRASQLLGKERKTVLDMPIKFGDMLGDRPQIELLDTMMLDPGISYPIHLLSLPIARSRLVYQNKDKSIEKFVREELQELNRTLLFRSLTALRHGFSPFEKRYELRDGMYRYKEFVHLKPQYIWIKINPKTKGFDGLMQRYHDNEVNLGPEKSYVFTYQNYFSNLYGKAQTIYAYTPWVLDKEFYRYHGVALQEYGLQTLLARAPEGKRRVNMGEAGMQEIDNLEFIRMIAESVHSRTSLALPSGEEWGLGPLFEKKQSNWDFNKDHDFLDLKKALAILVPPELWKSGGGSYAKSKVQSYWFEQTIGAILDELVGSIERHIIKPIIKLNFWSGKEEPPYGKLFGESPSLRYQEFVEELVKDYDKKERIDWTSIFKLMRLPLAEDTSENFGIESIPTDIKTLEGLCRKAYNKGIEIGKEELAFTGFVPISNDSRSALKDEAHKLQFMLRQATAVDSQRNAIAVILGRLRADGRVSSHEYFHSIIKNGEYAMLNDGGSSGKNVA